MGYVVAIVNPIVTLLAITAAVYVFKERLDRLEVRIDGIETRIDGRIDELGSRFEGRIDQLGSRIGGLPTREEMNARFDGLETRLTLVESETARARSDLTQFALALGVPRPHTG